MQIQRYLSKISGPLLDRIDLHLEVPEVRYKQLTAGSGSESSARVADRVGSARNVQLSRFREACSPVFCNAQMQPREVEKFCQLDGPTQRILESAIDQLGFSARAYNRILKVSRTIADLEGDASIRAEHVSEAVQYRSLDRNFWQSL